MRDVWLPLGLLVLVGVVPLACGQAFQLTGGTGTTAGIGGGASSTSVGATGGEAASSGGGSGTSTSTSTSTSTGSGGKLCAVASDCGVINNTLCGEATCMDGHCALHGLQLDGLSFSQLYGDCRTATCKKAKLVLDMSDDFYDDGNPCTKDACEGGVPVNKPIMGAQCGTNGVCNAKGACVECVGNGTCSDNTPTCINNYCSGQTCQNQLLDGNETDIDCGGDECGPCIPGQLCKVASDCLSKVCEDAFMGALVKQCKVPSCSDGVQNGSESDVDCGGQICPGSSKCDNMKHCSVHSDCKSGVCQIGTCQKATCGDGVKNGGETGIDCGAPGCALATCPGG